MAHGSKNTQFRPGQGKDEVAAVALIWTYGNGEWGKPEKVYQAYLCSQHAALFLQPMYSYVRKGAVTEKPCQLCQLQEHLEQETMNRQRLNGLYQAVIRQAFGQNWAAYHADCVIGMRGLPGNSVHFTTESPPFLHLYIYSDSVADLGNTESEEEFFIGYRFSIAEQYRVTIPGRYVAIHCKDTMRYMSSHGYAGLYDFPGEIIRNFQAEGFLFTRWITVWKDPVVEMQRTKTYGLLHKSFKERAEVTRQGCADFVLIFQKPYQAGPLNIVNEEVPALPPAVFERARHQWSQDGETVGMNAFAPHLSVWSKPLGYYSDEFIEELSRETQPGRLAVIHCRHLPAIGPDGLACKFDMMGEITRRFESQGNWKFHSRCALTDGAYLVTFRNWTPEFKKNYKELNGVVKHNLKAPEVKQYHRFKTFTKHYIIRDGEIVGEDIHQEQVWQEPVITGDERHTDYIGNQPPTNWHDDGYYSILVWQKYASPVWFDLEGLPESSIDCWMDIDQTDVLNARLVKEEEGEKHICPLQLGLIGRLIEEYTELGEIVMEPYLGIGSVIVEAVKRGRKGIGFELKGQYWEYATKYLREAEAASQQISYLEEYQAALEPANG
jgi:DNA modification methylase